MQKYLMFSCSDNGLHQFTEVGLCCTSPLRMFEVERALTTENYSPEEIKGFIRSLFFLKVGNFVRVGRFLIVRTEGEVALSELQTSGSLQS